MGGEQIALLLAILIGVTLGALGGGGSIITLPILVYVAGIAPESAVGMSMVIVGGTSFLGSYLQWRGGNFLPKPAALFGAAGILGAYLGSTGTHLISSSTLMLLFAGLMATVGALMLAQRRPLASDVRPSAFRCIASGFAVGLLTGFLGIGGGFLIVPALVWFAGFDARRAIGTSLGIIAVNSAVGLAGQLRYTHWDWPLTAKFLGCSLLGMGIGIRIARQAPEQALRKAFAIVVLGAAVAVAWQVLSHR